MCGGCFDQATCGGNSRATINGPDIWGCRSKSRFYEKCTSTWHVYISGQIIIFHQPRFPGNKEISLTKPPFGVRSCEVAIIWPDIYTVCSQSLGWGLSKHLTLNQTVHIHNVFVRFKRLLPSISMSHLEEEKHWLSPVETETEMSLRCT